VILDPKDYDRWLGPTKEPSQMPKLLHASKSKRWEIAEVSPKVNNAKFEGTECLAPE
jgi:putative SOS response-associated peptidase YedK